MLTFATPQSDPPTARKRSASRMFNVKIEEERPADTWLCISRASSKFLYFMT